LVGAIQSASGFALLGLREPYQTLPLNYSADFSDQPKNFDQGFRYTTPTMYYTVDPSFLSYFGTNGLNAIDQAMGILNSLTNVSSYSAGLEEFPLEEMRVNHAAQALGLLDLKSTVLEVMIEHMGLADPELFVWTLHNRFLPTGAQCPNYLYAVIQRNFDPFTISPSVYVNGNLFSYAIAEGCTAVDVGDAVEFLVDPSGIYGSAVASTRFTLNYGMYHTTLTRDDVGGLRWLYRTNNTFVSQAGPDTITYLTNTTTAQLLFTSNLTLLASQALTNNAAALQALYPDLVILNTTNIFTNIWTTNITAYFTNYPMDPVGTAPHIAFTTNRTLSIQTYYFHTFGNLFTLTNGPGGVSSVPVVTIGTQTGKRFVTLATTTITNKPYSPVGTVITNTTTKTYSTNSILGEFFIAPTNACVVNILGIAGTFTNTTTNILISATNTPAVTDPNNTNVYFFEQSLISYQTNHAFIVSPVACQTNSIALFQGIEKMTFIRRDYDSLLTRFFYPITNYYTLYAVTNNAILPQKVQRIISIPDFLFDADDLTVVGGPPLIHPSVAREVPAYTVATNGVFGGGSALGPGTIEHSSGIFTFNKVGPLIYNISPTTEAEATFTYIWGSFDGTTNAPVVYPEGTSIYAVENMALINIVNTSLATATVNAPYSEQLTALGGSVPYTWGYRPDSTQLPSGLTLSSDGSITGTPLQAGDFVIVIRLTDAGARYVDRAFTLHVNP